MTTVVAVYCAQDLVATDSSLTSCACTPVLLVHAGTVGAAEVAAVVEGEKAATVVMVL